MTTLRIVAKMTLVGQEVRNVFYVSGGDATHANAQDICDAIAAAYEDEWMPVAINQLSLYGFDVKELDDPANPTIEYLPTGGAVGGGVTGDVAPTQIAALISFKSVTAPPNRKRTYLPGLAEGAFDGNGMLNGTVRAAMISWADAMLALDTTTSLAIAFVISRIEPVTQTLVGSNILTQYLLSFVPATQRRRRIGRGI